MCVVNLKLQHNCVEFHLVHLNVGLFIYIFYFIGIPHILVTYRP